MFGDRLGATRYGGTSGGVHDLPTVVITAPTAGQIVASGGPVLRISWAYGQPQGDPEAEYRILIMDATETTTWHDSGFQAGPATLRDIDLVANGVPTDTEGGGLHVYVTVRSDQGPAYEATSAVVVFDVHWGTVAAFITSPVDFETITTPTVVVTWTFASTRDLLEGAYRVRLLTGVGTQLADSGWKLGNALTFEVPFTLSEGSGYQVAVTARNTQGVVSPETTAHFSTPTLSPTDFDLVESVGRVFEVAINGEGHMLYDGRDEEPDFVRSRQVASLDPHRFATTSTPFSESLERYSFVGYSDWRAGAGQRRGARQESAPNRYFDSDGINPFDPYQLTLMRDTASQIASAYASIRMKIASDKLYAVTAASQLKYISDPGGSSTTVNLTDGVGAISINDMTSDGQYWYVCDPASGVLRGTVSDPAAKWSTIAPVTIGWAGNRICAGVKASGSTPNRFTTLAKDGTEEVANGRITLDTGWTISSFASGGGFVWFAAFSSSGGVIYKWNMTADVPSVAMPLMTPHRPQAMFWYQGEVYVRTEVVHGATSKAALWRCEVDANGNLNPFLIASLDTGIAGPGAFGADERRVFFSWPDMDALGSDGLGAIDITTGGYARWLKGGVGAGLVRSIESWRGRTFFTVDGVGVYGESDTQYVASGWLNTSVDDLASALDKIWDAVLIRTKPLPVDTSVDLQFSLDAGDSYRTLNGGTLATAGQTGTDVELGERAHSIALQINLHAANARTDTPTFILAQAQCHPVGKADVILTLPIACYDTVTDLKGRPLPNSGRGAGAARSARLEALSQTRVLVQDVDWADSKIAEVFEVLGVQRKSRQVFDKNTGKNSIGEVMMLTLRRPLR